MKAVCSASLAPFRAAIRASWRSATVAKGRPLPARSATQGAFSNTPPRAATNASRSAALSSASSVPAFAIQSRSTLDLDLAQVLPGGEPLRGFTSSAAQPTIDRDRAARGPESLARRGLEPANPQQTVRFGPALKRAHVPRSWRALLAPHSWGPALLSWPRAMAGRSDRRGLQVHAARSSAKRAARQDQPCGTARTANAARQSPSPPGLALGAQAAVVQRPSYSETELSGKARAKNAQWAALVVRALRPIIPKKKIVKPHAVRRSLRARMTGSLDPTRHTDGEENARGGEPFQG